MPAIALIALTVGSREASRTAARVTTVTISTTRGTMAAWSIRHTEVDIYQHTFSIDRTEYNAIEN